MSKVTLNTIAEALEGLHKQVASLADRITALEQQATTTAGAPAVHEEAVSHAPELEEAAAPEAAHEEIPEDILLAISAAVAAYLGQRAHVRAVRLIAGTRWSQEGRVSIQASHYLNRG